MVNTSWTLQYKLIQPRCHSSYSGNNFPYIMDKSFRSSFLWVKDGQTRLSTDHFLGKNTKKTHIHTHTPTQQQLSPLRGGNQNPVVGNGPPSGSNDPPPAIIPAKCQECAQISCMAAEDFMEHSSIKAGQCIPPKC